MFGASLHAVGWPIPRGGARAIAHALAGYLDRSAARAYFARIDAAALSELDPRARADTLRPAPRQLLAIAGDQLHARLSARFRAIPATARAHSRSITRSPSPCLARAGLPARHHGAPGRHFRGDCQFGRCRRAGPVAERPFVLVAQPTLFDPTRAPDGHMCCGPIATCPTARPPI